MQVRSYDNRELIPEIVRLINEGHSVTLRVKGRSMRPFLEDGRDKVVLAKPECVEVGDVVLADTVEKGYVIHRLAAFDKQTGWCVLRGDGNLDFENCDINDVLAKVVAFVRKNDASGISVDSRRWRLYSWIWMRLLPVRRYLLAFYRICIIRQR